MVGDTRCGDLTVSAELITWHLAPSYFSHYFIEQLARVEEARRAGNLNAEIPTLYIDRDPKLFRDIYHHLQGYHVMPRDAEHWAELFVDAHYYARMYRLLWEIGVQLTL